jgi:hypothetical protein
VTLNNKTQKMIVKIHSTPNGNLLAICDSDLIGKTFEEDDKQLDLSSQFYAGEEMSEQELTEILKDCYVVNAVGKESISILVKNNLINKENIMRIAGTPHAQCVVEH